MKIGLLVLLFLAYFYSSNTQLISTVDFTMGAVYTGAHLWDNFIGLSIDYSNTQVIMNSSLFQGYIMNSNIKGNWANNFAVSIKSPLGIKYNCSGLQHAQPSVHVVCNQDTVNNNTYWTTLGNFV
jgi:hypothetical protein